MAATSLSGTSPTTIAANKNTMLASKFHQAVGRQFSMLFFISMPATCRPHNSVHHHGISGGPDRHSALVGLANTASRNSKKLSLGPVEAGSIGGWSFST